MNDITISLLKIFHLYCLIRHRVHKAFFASSRMTFPASSLALLCFVFFLQQHQTASMRPKHHAVFYLIFCVSVLATFLVQNALGPERKIKGLLNLWLLPFIDSCTKQITFIKYNMPALQMKEVEIKDIK